MDGRLTCQLSQTLWGTVVHHQAEWTVLYQQLHCVEKPVIHRLHTVTHTHTKTGFQCGSYYDKLLLTSTPDGGIKERKKHKLKTLDRKQAPNIFKSTDLSSCNVCTLTKINDKAEEKCTEKWFSLFLDPQTTEPQCYIVLMNDCIEEEPCCEPGSWPSAPRVTLRRKPACVCVWVCVWMSVSEVSHSMTFARKETDSYRDSGLARPKGGAGWDEGVYVGVVNLTAPLFTHEVLPSHQREWAENGEAPLSAGGPRAEHGDRIKGWSEEANYSGGTDGENSTSTSSLESWCWLESFRCLKGEVSPWTPTPPHLEVMAQSGIRALSQRLK